MRSEDEAASRATAACGGARASHAGLGHTAAQGQRPATAHDVGTKLDWGPWKRTGDRKGVCLWGLAVARWTSLLCPVTQRRPVGPGRSLWLRGGHLRLAELP